MRLKLFISILFSVGFLMSTVAPVLANLDYVPTLKTPLNQRDKFDTDLFSGSATFSYPIKVPKGTDDLTPDVTFSYNSAGVRDLKTYLGLGWQLNQDYVERDVNYTPGSTGDDKFKLHFKGAVHDLVYVSSEGRYHTKIESFLKIEKFSGGSNDYGDYWQVITPDGTKYRFGYQGQSELACNGRSHTASWNLDQVTDVHDNKIYYTYLENNGISYVSQIKYNNDQSRIIDFSYTTNPYEHPVYNQGCYAYDLKRLTNIQVKIDTNLVHEYDMTFGQTGNTMLPILDKITEKGSDRSALPSSIFYYKAEVHSWNPTPTKFIDNVNLDGLTLGRDDVTIADMNGDALPDIVKTDHHGGPNVSWKVLLNNGGNSWATSYQYWANNVNMDDARLNRSTKDVRLIDVTSDNLPDVVMAAGADNWRLWKNTGTGFVLESIANLSGYGGDVKLSSNNITLADMTGDGRADIVQSQWASGGYNWRVFRNTGAAWDEAPTTWSSTVPVGLDSPEQLKLIDVNGDGYTDIVRTVTDGSPMSTWQVWLNTGTGFASQATWLNDTVGAYFQNFDGVGPSVTVADVNGDNLPDIIRSIDLGTNDRWKVLYNRGGSWSNQWDNWIETTDNVDADAHNNDVKMFDATGDGIVDIVYGYNTGSGGVTWKVWKNNNLAPHLLESAHNPQGGIRGFEYIKSTGFDNTGSDSLSDLPFPMWLVDKMTITNGMGGVHGTVDITNYTYKDGLYKWQDKEFRGFGEVNTTEPNGTKKKYVFHQTDTVKGKPDEIQTRDNAGNPYLETEYIWSTPQSNGITANYLDSEKNYTYDGSASNPKITQNDFEYDNYGNITKSSQKGDTATNTDDRFTYNVYTYNTSSWIVNTLRNTYTKAADDSTKVAEKWLYYDSNTWIDDAPTKGDLTKEVTWLDGGTNPIKLFEYDAYGNLVEETDANNHVTEYAYDSATHTYPTSTTNAKNQTTTVSYDIGTGNMLTKTDPNNKTTINTYDTYGRITKEIKPEDSSDYPTTSYQYFFDGAAPEGILVSKRETASTSGTLDTYTFIDGLERKIQTRVDAEDPAKHLVTDTFYDASGEVKKETVPYLDTPTLVAYPVINTVASATSTSVPNAGWVLLDSMTITDTFASTSANLGFSAVITNNSPNSTVYVSVQLDGVDKTGDTFVTGGSGSTKTMTTSLANVAITSGQHTVRAMVWTNSNTVSAGYRSLNVTTPSNETYALYSNPDTNAKYTELTYDALKRVIIAKNTKGDDKTTSYDHWKETTIDENGHIKRTFTNGFGKIVKIEEVNDGSTYTTTYNYDSKDQLTKITDNASNEITFTYDTMGRKTSQVDPDMGTWSYEYDAVGNLTKQTDARNIEITKTYDELNRITKTDYPTDTDTTYLYDANGKLGTLSIATDSAGTVNYQYDNRLRKIHEQRSVNGTTKTTQFSYDSADRMKTQTNPDGEMLTYGFNTQGEVESVTGSSTIVSDIDYNALGKITQKSFGNGLTTDYTYNTTTDFRLNRIQTSSIQDLNYTYDNVGNISSITDGVQSKTQNFTYDDLDRLKTASESAGYNYAYQYNSIGNLTKFTNSGVDTNYSYGGNGKPHAMTSSTETVSPPSPVTTGTPKTATLTDNWASGSIPSNKWTNWGGAQVTVSSQELRMTSTLGGGYYGVDSGINGKVYDLAGSSIVNKVVDAGNQSIGSWEVYPLYTYVNGDSSNQFFFFIGENKVRAYKKVNGASNWLAQADYNATNHKWFRIREAGGTTYFDTSANGINWTNFASVANPFSVSSMVIGSEIGTWTTESSTTTAVFDNFNYATPATSTISDDWTTGSINGSKWLDWSEGQASVVNQQLNMSSTTGGGYYGVDSGVSGAAYNLTGSYAVTQLVDAGNQSIGSWEVYPLYTYVLGDSSTQYFWYLSENTLRAYKKVSGSNTVLASASYNSVNHKWFRIREAGGTTYFDTSANGESWTNFASTANAFDVTAMVVGAEVGTWNSEGSTTTAKLDNFNVWNPAYTYDANGNMTSDGFRCYEFNEANQMKKVKSCDNSQTIAEYVYDFKGDRMVKKNFESGTLKNTVISWSDSFETKIIEGGATENTAYYFANSQLLAKKDKNGNKTYIHADHLGSTNVVTNQAGDVMEKTEYDPWGEIKDGGTQNKFMYTGQEKDSETGLHYYNARYYDPHIRRFTQPDDIIQNAFEPQTLNRYSYVQNNPLKYTDPTGHVSILDYNKMLSNPTKKNYNSTMSQFAKIAGNTAMQGSTTSKSGQSNGGGSSSAGGAILAAGSAGTVIKQNQINGAKFEKMILDNNNFTKNTTLLKDYGNRIPDILDEGKKIVGECKSGSYICLTPQLKDLLHYAKDTTSKFTLYTKEGAKVSQPLQDAIQALPAGAPYMIGASVIDAAPVFIINQNLITPDYTRHKENQQL